MPSYFWISEISLPELFPVNKRKIADIIIDSSVELDDDNMLEVLLFLRVPGELAIRVSDEIRIYPTQSKSHIPIIEKCKIQ